MNVIVKKTDTVIQENKRLQVNKIKDLYKRAVSFFRSNLTRIFSILLFPSSIGIVYLSFFTNFTTSYEFYPSFPPSPKPQPPPPPFPSPPPPLPPLQPSLRTDDRSTNFSITSPNKKFDSFQEAQRYCDVNYSGIACPYKADILNKMEALSQTATEYYSGYNLNSGIYSCLPPYSNIPIKKDTLTLYYNNFGSDNSVLQYPPYPSTLMINGFPRNIDYLREGRRISTDNFLGNGTSLFEKKNKRLVFAFKHGEVKANVFCFVNSSLINSPLQTNEKSSINESSCEPICTNNCSKNIENIQEDYFKNLQASSKNGICEDTGPDSLYSDSDDCDYGDDCEDCGSRCNFSPPSNPPPVIESPPPFPPPSPTSPGCNINQKKSCSNDCILEVKIYNKSNTGEYKFRGIGSRDVSNNGCCNERQSDCSYEITSIEDTHYVVVETEICDPGTDCLDCGIKVCKDSYSPPFPSIPPFSCPEEEMCNENCTYSNDGYCDDGGIGSSFDDCDVGTDCLDCGKRCTYTENCFNITSVKNISLCTVPYSTNYIKIKFSYKEENLVAKLIYTDDIIEQDYSFLNDDENETYFKFSNIPLDSCTLEIQNILNDNNVEELSFLNHRLELLELVASKG